MTTILLVDDDPLQAFLTMSLLRRQSAEVRRVTDAAEALCLIEQPDFSSKLGLVISGHHSAGIGGPAFVAELRARLPECLSWCSTQRMKHPQTIATSAFSSSRGALSQSEWQT